MSSKQFGKNFNTTLQNVDDKYNWINDMIKARKELVIQYMKILNVSVSRSSNKNDVCYPSYEDVTKFCDQLVDYMSHGHFDLFPKILELIENASGRSLSIAHRTLPRIEDTTEYLMKFTDKYAEDLNEAKMATVQKDLSSIGKALEVRFKNEDRLIIALRLVHSIVSG
ncbi:MAG: Rsd/AlgQ family anti-sigma factor [Succinivibrio dextrinosolvens]|uniref:Regulator of sigma D n=1 Tax=Succinivibrio dextrinosolvens TaxID=83771 RepID=A0A662Z7W2_9GAMM|nr:MULTISPECIES: Rsd/AlgQ family anti-sigma factor [Succinivibrio]MBQ9221056.1 sigma D regulator [Succinivibrio sp.]MDY6415820.1 Rsd/AlgQ family anti-sigma factor [Succinivibrio dextrinosolvens]MDY6421342.1 Rsd/AlgQ family anti-sigma factor [Succinivibrio dextrinosolvens]MDY6465184.1 Rsd/AlgQ family anti-sigma factor [Succinivibrio dextrinosolvens]MDY6471202.1 Rsd/AlgQ family anti-sigma factor [Succinivibrio dextrinosolvens]